MKTEFQILKTRDDKVPVFLSRAQDDGQSGELFEAKDGADCPWLNKDEKIGPAKLRPRIEPWLTALFQSEHLALLVGSGLSNAVHYIATGDTLPGMDPVVFAQFQAEIQAESKRSADAAGRQLGNIEDEIRVANELLRGLEILAGPGNETKAQKEAATLKAELTRVLGEFAAAILNGERGLIEAPIPQREKAFNYLVSFLMSFASRTGTRDRLQVFTTNYDRYLEAGSEVAGLHLLDRFVGSIAPVFRSSRLDIDMHYNPPGIRGEPRYLEGVARFSKLHGSLDWVSTNSSIRRIGLPFGAQTIDPYLSVSAMEPLDALQLMIYPNSAKDRETACYPYVELFRDFAAAVCRPNSTLVCFGFSFGDEHINRVIEDMLTIPSAHLVVISRSDPLGRIMQTYQRLGRHAQVTLLVGDHLGDFETLVDNYLPKPAIDRTTFRMAELLKARWDTMRTSSPSESTSPNTEEVEQ